MKGWLVLKQLVLGVRSCVAFSSFSSALTPCPLSRGAGEGEQATRRALTTPLSHAVGEGLGVRANKQTHIAPPHPNAASLLAYPPAHAVGEGLGVRANKQTHIAPPHSNAAPLLAYPPAHGVGEELAMKTKSNNHRLMSRLLLFVTAALFLLAPARSQPQFDDFRGNFDAQLNWSWQVPRNSPFNSQDASRVQFTGDALVITAQAGTLYQNLNNIRNLPSLSVPALRGAWSIETRVRLQRNGLSSAYLQAGIVVLRDADNYFNLHLVYLPDNNNWLSVSGGHEQNGVYQWAGLSGVAWNPSGGDTARLLIRYEPDTGRVRFFYDREDGAHWRELSGSPRLLSDFPSLQAVANNGGQVGLYVDTAGGTGTPAPAATFDYLLILSDYHPADVNQDGVVDDADLLSVLFAFGTQRCNHPADVNQDGVVDDADLLQVLFAFGAR